MQGTKGRIYPMKSTKWILVAAIAVAFFHAPNAFAQQTNTQLTTTESQKTNIRPYVELLRSDVRAEKTAIMGQMMQFNDEQDAKFWPIYREYDFELQKLNDQKLAGIREYAKTYGSMTDQKADELA